MKDPEYQEMMMVILKDPEMEESAVELMKTKNYRREVMTIMAEAFESPYFVAKINDILANVSAQQVQEKAQEGSEEGGGGGEEGEQ